MHKKSIFNIEQEKNSKHKKRTTLIGDNIFKLFPFIPTTALENIAYSKLIT